jgi:hypothetical protein
MKKSKKLSLKVLTKDLKLVNENMDKDSKWITETLEEILELMLQKLFS